METLALSLFLISAVLGVIFTFFGSIGLVIILAGILYYAWVTQFTVITVPTLVFLVALYITGEILEFILTFWGAKRFGGSSQTAWGAVIGGIIGAIAGSIFFGIGAIPGTFLGIFLGGVTVEYRKDQDLPRACKAGLGGVFGRVGSIAAKILIAILMITITLMRIIGAGYPS